MYGGKYLQLYSCRAYILVSVFFRYPYTCISIDKTVNQTDYSLSNGSTQAFIGISLYLRLLIVCFQCDILGVLCSWEQFSLPGSHEKAATQGKIAAV